MSATWAAGSRGGWPRVSVVVPTHRRPELLVRALGNILDQRYEGTIDCLVVFDREPPLLPTLPTGRDRHLHALVNTRTPGPAGARNEGLLAADGSIVALCDDDDEWHPDKLRAQVQALQRHPDAILATCGILAREGRRQFARIPRNGRLSLDHLIASRHTEVHTSTLTAWREPLLDRVGLIDEAIPGAYGEDYDWILRVARLAPLVAVREPLVRVRLDTSSFAGRWEMIIEALTYQLERRPELSAHPANLARIQGRLAFAYAATGDPGQARRWARRSIRTDWRQPRGWLALLVGQRVVPARTVVRLARLMGRGV